MRQTSLSICAALLAVGVVTGAALHFLIPSRCAAPGEADKQRLIRFVRLKYGLPSNAAIGVADGGPVLNSCFRELVFANLSGAQFRAVLYGSPDFRFLIPELLAAQPDPKQLAERRRQTAESLAAGNAPKRGKRDAPVTLAVFSDFQCPFCARLTKTLNDLAASGADRLRIVYHYFPLSKHGWARPAAEAAACAQRQSDAAFWSLHDFLFAHQSELSPGTLPQGIAGWERTAVNFDEKAFETCVGRSLTAGQVEQDLALGSEVGVEATPTVFLNGEPIGDTSPGALKALIEQATTGR